jgi:hypothetical protein
LAGNIATKLLDVRVGPLRRNAIFERLLEFNEGEFSPKVLINQPGYRLALLNIRASQGLLELPAEDMVTIRAITGRIKFDGNKTPAELRFRKVFALDLLSSARGLDAILVLFHDRL